MNRKIAIVTAIILVLGLCGCSGPSASTDAQTVSPSTELTATNTPVSTPTQTPESTPAESLSETESADGLAGRIDGDQYINDTLGFKVTIPRTEWVFATDGGD